MSSGASLLTCHFASCLPKGSSCELLPQHASGGTGHKATRPLYSTCRCVYSFASTLTHEFDDASNFFVYLGKILFVPRVDHDRGEIDMLRIYDEQDLNTLSPSIWGIPEPGLERNGCPRQNGEHAP